MATVRKGKERTAKSRSLTPIRKGRDWVRDDSFAVHRNAGGGRCYLAGRLGEVEGLTR